jgi:acyl-CoA thioesterase-1
MNPRVLWTCLVFPIASSFGAAPPSQPAFDPVPENPALPRVLLIGDSISIAYTEPVRQRLAGKANLQRIPENGGDTNRGLAELDKWLTTGGKTAQAWDVIHFNWGLHDLCYRVPGQPTSRDKIAGKVAVPIAQYTENLETLVKRLKLTGAKLIFATTTPVPEAEAGRKVGDDLAYNDAALAVMKRYGVAIDDLNAVVAGNLGRYAIGPGNVHYNESGTNCLADQVTASITTALHGGAFPLFDGTTLSRWQPDEDGGWVIDGDRSLTCTFKDVTGKDGKPHRTGRGYLWTRKAYENFELTLSYKLSAGANSGVFFHADPTNPVQGGFEIQLIDDSGFESTHGPLGERNKNGALYDAVPPAARAAHPLGQWNTLRIVCNGPRIQAQINGVTTVDADISQWITAEKNPDGSPNKFLRPLATLPRTGRIGLQNHGDAAWFKDIQIKPL